MPDIKTAVNFESEQYIKIAKFRNDSFLIHILKMY